MGRARPFVCAFDCVGMGIRWTARTAVARAWDGRLLVRRLRAFDCLSVWPAWDGRLHVRPSARVVGRSTARPPAARVRLLVGLARMGRSTACSSVCARATATARLRACDCDCTSRGHGKHGHGKGVCACPTACRSGPPGKTCPCRLCVFDCDCTTRGHGKHGHEKGTAPQKGRARVLGTNWTLSASSVLPHWFESSLLTSNKAVQVAGVHCVRLNSYPSW